MKDKEFLGWIRDRLQHVHGESKYLDYMHKLKAIVDATPEDQITPNIMSTDMLGYESEMEDMKQQFTVTPGGNMTYHGDKPIHVGVGVIFNPGDTLVRVEVEDKSGLCGANESLVNINPNVVAPVGDGLADDREAVQAIINKDRKHQGISGRTDDDWIEWKGGVRPVDGDLEVVAKLRNGDEMIRRSYDLSWAHCPNGDLDSSQDIIAYRPNYPEFLKNPMNDDGITDHELVSNWEDKAEWNDNGLPLVGTVCECAVLSQMYHEFEIRGYFQGKVWMASDETGDIAEMLKNCEFRPIKTPKEKAIEEMYEIAMDVGHDERDIANAFYDKGYRRQGNNDE